MSPRNMSSLTRFNHLYPYQRNNILLSLDEEMEMTMEVRQRRHNNLQDENDERAMSAAIFIHRIDEKRNIYKWLFFILLFILFIFFIYISFSVNLEFLTYRNLPICF